LTFKILAPGKKVVYKLKLASDLGHTNHLI